MNSSSEPQPTPADARLEAASATAISRMLRVLLAAGACLLIPAAWAYGWLGGVGFAAGAGVSYVNFRALTRGVEALADRVVNRHSTERGGKIVLRFLVRYALVAVVAYAIFEGSVLAFRGFLWGLCLPVVAMMAEAAWETYLALRK
jgi:ATP synthase I chain